VTTVTEYTYHSWLEHLSVTVPGGNYSLLLESVCEYHSNISQSCFSGGNHAVSIRAEPCLRSKLSLGQPSLSLPFVEHEGFLSFHVHYGLPLDWIRQHKCTPSNHLYLETILILLSKLYLGLTNWLCGLSDQNSLYNSHLLHLCLCLTIPTSMIWLSE
jgi:hypothetical protein